VKEVEEWMRLILGFVVEQGFGSVAEMAVAFDEPGIEGILGSSQCEIHRSCSK